LSTHTSYYLDESGDLNLFNKRKKPVNNDGSSNFIMLGVLKIKEQGFEEKFLTFREAVLTDPIFQTFPSIEKTKRAFHAKDDHIAVKREVFNFIKGLDLSVQVIIRRRSVLIDQALSQFHNTGRKLDEKQLYLDLVTRLFKNNLHKSQCFKIYFSHRSKTTEYKALKGALQRACDNFYKTHNIRNKSTHEVICLQPSQEPGLQIIDYCLWALQRLYERKESVYFSLLQDKFKLIMDIDDKSNKPYGELYSARNVLCLSKLKG
jgi:hypothetical protein